MTSEQSPSGHGTPETSSDGRSSNRPSDGRSSDQPTTAPTEWEPGRTTEVLYVDDEDPPSALSEADDVAVSAVPSAAAARDRLAADGSVDCVVSEYDLPDSDGLALLESVRDDHPNLPFVVFTGSGSERVASEAIGMGATDYLPKEVEGEELRRRVGRAVAATSVETDSGVTGDRLRELTTAFPDVAFLFDETGRYLEVLSGPGTEDLRTVDQEQLVGKRLHDVFEESKADRFLDHVRTTLETGGVETIEYRTETSTGERWYEGRTAPLGETIDGREAVVWVARDVTERRDKARELAESRDQLRRLTRINGLIHSILQSLVGSATRDEIEQIVCEGLAESEFYQFAWIGGPWVKEERMNPHVVEGVERSELEQLIEATTARSGHENSIARVVGEGESVVVPDVSESEILSEREREIMDDLDMRSAVLVPLAQGNINYGVLGISGTRTGTFTDRELTMVETLGDIVSFAINAVKNRNLLFSDTAVELEFRVRDSKSVFGRISAEHDCEAWLEGIVPVSDERLLEYVAFEDVPTDAVLERLDDAGIADELQVVSDDGDECVLELVLSESGVNRLVKAGTVVKSARARDGEVKYVAEAPSEVDVRTVVESFRQAYPDSELVSKQEVNRPVYTAQEFQQTLADNLTEKQRTALQAAYFAGYYEYPRESTGEDVADSLGISSPTLHQHLRSAQRKLVETFLDV